MKTSLRASTPRAIIAARAGAVEDANEMGGLVYPRGHIPHEMARDQCARILREPFGFSVAVTRQVGRSLPEIVGAQNAALVLPWFVDELITDDRPYVHNRIQEANRNPFPTESEVGRSNAGDGLDMLLGHFAVRGDLDPAEAIRVRGLMISSFGEFFAGNRVRSILVETKGRETTLAAMGAGFQLIKDYGGEEGARLLRIDLARALEVHNFHFARLLHTRPPLFHFPPAGREALRFALQGLTDAQVLARQGLSAASLASRWSRLFDIVEEVMPELFGGARGARARERLPLLTYVRNHPEELWPYDLGKSER